MHFCGDQEAFTLLYKQAGPVIHAYLRRLCGCPYLAEDMIQETFLAVFRNKAGFQGRSSPLTWLYSIANNKYRDHLRNRWGKVEVDSF